MYRVEYDDHPTSFHRRGERVKSQGPSCNSGLFHLVYVSYIPSHLIDPTMPEQSSTHSGVPVDQQLSVPGTDLEFPEPPPGSITLPVTLACAGTAERRDVNHQYLTDIDGVLIDIPPSWADPRSSYFTRRSMTYNNNTGALSEDGGMFADLSFVVPGRKPGQPLLFTNIKGSKKDGWNEEVHGHATFHNCQASMLTPPSTTNTQSGHPCSVSQGHIWTGLTAPSALADWHSRHGGKFY